MVGLIHIAWHSQTIKQGQDGLHQVQFNTYLSKIKHLRNIFKTLMMLLHLTLLKLQGGNGGSRMHNSPGNKGWCECFAENDMLYFILYLCGQHYVWPHLLNMFVMQYRSFWHCQQHGDDQRFCYSLSFGPVAGVMALKFHFQQHIIFVAICLTNSSGNNCKKFTAFLECTMRVAICHTQN